MVKTQNQISTQISMASIKTQAHPDSNTYSRDAEHYDKEQPGNRTQISISKIQIPDMELSTPITDQKQYNEQRRRQYAGDIGHT